MGFSESCLGVTRKSNTGDIQRQFSKTNEDSSSGDYVLYAENAVGNDTLTMRFYAEGKFVLLTCTH